MRIRQRCVSAALVALAGIFTGLFSASNAGLNPATSMVFDGPSLPTPPQQQTPWKKPATTLPVDLVWDVNRLYEQGVADPRGGEYREIKVVISDFDTGTLQSTDTHGWVFPQKPGEANQFAVCWNGLVYPCLSVGKPADLKADVRLMLDPHAEKDIGPRDLFEFWDVAYKTFDPFRICPLVRLGEIQLAEEFWNASQMAHPEPNQPTDPYLPLATEWARCVFDRAINHHIAGSDFISRDMAELLTKAVPLIDSTAGDLNAPAPVPPGDNSDYLPFCDPLPDLLSDERRRTAEPRRVRATEHPERYPQKAGRIAELINELEDTRSGPDSSPGNCDGVPKPVDQAPVVEALVKEGPDAIPPLLECIDHDDRFIRTVLEVDIGNRQLVPVRSVAIEILCRILQFRQLGPVTDKYRHEVFDDWPALRRELRSFCEVHRGEPPAEIWYDVLRDDNASESQWKEAIKRIVGLTDADIETEVDWPGPDQAKPFDDLPIAGESLRSKANPSVSDLMLRRLTSKKDPEPPPPAPNGMMYPDPPEVQDGFTRDPRMGLAFFRWDAKAALPIIQDDLSHYFKESTSGGGRGQWIGQFVAAAGTDGDTAALSQYADWIAKQRPDSPGKLIERIDILKPLWRFPDDPKIRAATEALLSDPKSRWSDLAAANQSCLLETPLVAVPAFETRMMRNLKDMTEIGTASTEAENSAEARMTGHIGLDGTENAADPLLRVPTHQTVRVCDWYARKVTKLDGCPEFELYWPLAKRDEAREAIIAFLNQYGHRFAYSPLQQTLVTNADTPGEKAQLAFPKLDHPATAADVSEGRAIFSLTGGQVRQIPVENWPAKARWVTLKKYGRVDVEPSPSEPGASIAKLVYTNSGRIWQAEEVLVDGVWHRYYGFVGPHTIARVPAEEIEFDKD